MNLLLNNLFIKLDAPQAWGIYFQDSATPLPYRFGKTIILGIKLPNSGKALKFIILNQVRKFLSGWSNYSGIVTSYKISENAMGNRGSKSILNIVKEQRVYGNWYGINLPYLRCTLMGFERSYQNKILTTQLIRKISSIQINEQKNNNNIKLTIDPNFFSGFADAEGSFVLSITKSNNVSSGWVIKPRFQIHLHKKDLFILEAIQNFFGVGKIYKRDINAVEFRVFSIKELKVILEHFDKFPLLSQKYADFILFKEAYELIVNKEHLTAKGLRKIISIRASINNGLSEQLKNAFSDITYISKPVKENISIYNPQWLAGFTSGEGSFGVKIRNANTNGNTKAYVELIFQINQHVRDTQLLNCIAKYLNCGKIYKHSAKAEVLRVSKTLDLIENIIPFFVKYPILGIKALDFKDFCSILDLTLNKEHHTEEGLNKIIDIKANINTGRKFE